MPVEDFIPWILGSVALLFVGYLLNGWRERSFERKRTNYHAKLEHFREIDDAVMHLSNVVVYFRMLLERDWESGGEDLQAFWDMAWFASLARDEETPLRTQVVEKIMEDLKKASLHDDEERRESAFRDWLEATLPSLAILWVRVLAFHFNRLTKLRMDVRLVAESPVVLLTVDNLAARVMEELGAEPEAGTTLDSISVERIKRFQKRLSPAILALQDSMRREIQITLAGPIERWRKRIRVVRVATGEAEKPTEAPEGSSTGQKD